MSTPFHIVLSLFIGYIIWPPLSIPFAILGAGPDLFPFLRWLLIDKRNPELRWKWYNEIHLNPIKLWQWILMFPWALHIWMDKFVHKPNGGWTENALVIEVCLWLVLLIAIYGTLV